MASRKSGLVAATRFIEAACAVNETWGPKLTIAINDAVTAGRINSSQASTAIAFLATLSAACAIFKAASGY